jgi:hypothetical protein
MVVCGTATLAIKPTLSGVPGAIPKSHRRPQLLLGLSIPISAVQFEENRCIRKPHVGFDYQHSKQLASAIELRDYLFVGKDTHLGSREQGAEPFSVALKSSCPCPGRWFYILNSHP